MVMVMMVMVVVMMVVMMAIVIFLMETLLKNGQIYLPASHIKA